MMNWLKRHPSEALLLMVSGFVMLTANRSFFAHLLEAYPPAVANAQALVVIALLGAAFLTLLLALSAWGRLTKPLLLVVLLISALSAAFMDAYGIVIDSAMLLNASRTDWAEARDVLTPSLAWRMLFFAGLPMIFVWRWPLPRVSVRSALLARGQLLIALLALSVVLVASSSGLLASFARNHKSVRSYANPTYPLYALGKFARKTDAVDVHLIPSAIAADARIAPHDKTRDLLFIVVGETARADHFGLNGYARDTTPILSKSSAISLSNVQSCGTATAYSVPCMFSSRGQADFDPDHFQQEENLLDVLQRAGVNVLWLDSNSNSQGVATRVPTLDYRSSALNPMCDVECRDEGMLVDLQARIDAFPKGDVVVVLHQMGNHGPAYYKRYPSAFARFLPECRTADLSRCTRDEVINAYDNAIAYTDHFLGQAIALLQRNKTHFDTALFYMSDHGESLGEKGIWLHGMPRTLAPKEQRHVPAVLWFGESTRQPDLATLRARHAQAFSHDNLFHTVLGFLEIQTADYRPNKDVLAISREVSTAH
jgi:lipid A ethanolaminephosphotransferase